MCRHIPAQWSNGLLSYAPEISTAGRGNVIWQCYFSTRVHGCSCSPLCLGAVNPLTCVMIRPLIIVPFLVFDLRVYKCYRTSSHPAFCLCSILHICPVYLFSVVPGEEILDLKFTPLLGNCLFLILPVWKWENVSVVVLLHIPIYEPPLSLRRCHWPDIQTRILGCQNEQQQPSCRWGLCEETKLQGNYSSVASMAMKWLHVV